MKKKYWSKEVTEKSNALDLEKGVFTFDDPKRIASSLKRSAENSSRRKGMPYQSAMSILNFYINRAGKNLKPERIKILEQAKENLRKQIDPALVEKWLTGAQGWWEVDSLC